MSPDVTHELEVATAAARDAARLIRKHRETLRPEAVHEKGRRDLVTNADLASQKLIVDTLRSRFPTYGFLAEEDHRETELTDSTRRWVIDPIDGTTNFTHGVPPYAVSIGLMDREEVIAGVVLDVVSGETFTAIRGRGSYLDGRRIHVSETSLLNEALISTGFPYRSIGHVDQYLTVLREFMIRSRGVRRHGSAAIDLAYLAAGRFDGFFETGLGVWDVAAGSLLIEEAGGTATTFGGTRDYLFGGQILASNGRLQAEMSELVQPLADVDA